MSGAQWLVVARREFVERVRTRWFIVVTLLGPVLLAALIIVPALLAVDSMSKGVDIEILDHSGEALGQELVGVAELEGSLLRVRLAVEGATEDGLRARVKDQSIEGYLLLPVGVMLGETAIYTGENASAPGLENRLERLVNTGVRRIRGRKIGLRDEQITELLSGVDVDAKQSTGAAEATSGEASFFVGYAVMFILYMSILLYAVNVMRSVVLEKTSRVVEMIVSALKPRALMLGKIMGVGSVGVFQLGIWSVLAVVMFRFREQILGVFGIPGAGAVDLPPIAVTDLLVVLAYFFGGFFFYASLYAAIGAMVNSDQEAQQAQTPVMMLLVIPAVCVQLVAGDPRGTASEVLTMIPLFSPILMPMRWVLGGATPVELIISLAILGAAIAGAVWLAARIYRVGILMYGKRPSLRELARWIRYQ